MGRLIIISERGKVESFKCKSEERAREIISNRTYKEWHYYERGERIPKIEKENYVQPQSFEELDRLIKSKGLLDRVF